MADNLDVLRAEVDKIRVYGDPLPTSQPLTVQPNSQFSSSAIQVPQTTTQVFPETTQTPTTPGFISNLTSNGTVKRVGGSLVIAAILVYVLLSYKRSWFEKAKPTKKKSKKDGDDSDSEDEDDEDPEIDHIRLVMATGIFTVGIFYGVQKYELF